MGRVGQRPPGRYPLHAELAGVTVASDAASANAAGTDALSDPVPLFAVADDVNGTVQAGSAEDSYVFDGTSQCYFNVPEHFHPAVQRRLVINFRVRPMPDCRGYVLAKTDPAGISRYWAVGIAKSKAGTSIQFYYQPRGVNVGHRLISANVGRYTSGTMDPEYLITGHDDEVHTDEIQSYRAQLRNDRYRFGSDMASVSGMRDSLNRQSMKMEKRGRTRPSRAEPDISESLF